MLNPKIFKRYDIRGRYPDDIDDNKARILVDAYIEVFSPDKVVIGHDTLEGSKAIYEPVCDQFLINGVKVLKAGEVTSPILYFASAHYDVPQGIMLTASHLGVGNTGFKGVINGIPPAPEKIKAQENASNKITNPKVKDTATYGECIYLENIYEDYISKVKELIKPLKNPTRYNFVFDVSNGANAHVIPELGEYLNLDYTLINEEIKDKDLAHDTNPKIEKNREQLVTSVKSNNAEVGIIWDGDADRAYFVDHNGEIIAPEFIGVYIGAYLIKNKQGSIMTIDVRGSSAVEQEVSKVGGSVKRIQAWHVPIKFEMEKNSEIVFGMETSGHYVFRDMNKADDGLLASLMFIAALDSEENDIRELLLEFRSKYKIVEEVNFRTIKSEETLVNEFKEIYPDAVMTDIDGITIDYPDWRFNVRSSRTEPIIRLNISGSDFDKVDKNLELLKTQIGGTILE